MASATGASDLNELLASLGERGASIGLAVPGRRLALPIPS